jgi:hypothetical protein
MKRYIAYTVACLALVGTLTSCTADELEPQKNPIDNAKGGFIGIDPIQPSIPRPLF